MITEVARSILAEWETTLDELFIDIDGIGHFQHEILRRQLVKEQEHGDNFVSDRAFDSIAYAAEHTTIASELMSSPQFQQYVNQVNRGIVLFLRPSKHLLKDDGTRASTHLIWDSVIKIDGMIKFMLEKYQTKYLPISESNMQERVRIIQFILGRDELRQKENS